MTMAWIRQPWPVRVLVPMMEAIHISQLGTL
jgi:hypothetical protein